jgi:hypothetical protein
VEVGSHFVAFRGGADGPAGLLLAINPSSISHISSYYDKKRRENMLRLHLVNGRTVAVFESDAENVLEKLGLEQYVNDWVYNLEKDVG